MTPVTAGIEISQIKLVFATGMDGGHRAADLAGDERFSSRWPLVIEKDAIRGVHAVGFAVIHGNPIRIELSGAVGAARPKRGPFVLGRLDGVTIELRGR